ncbi:MAG: hypothetical protein M3Z50_11440 [Actinomycetota bacterium]|nr:hypothetical protein [Actinomycetota bacterium]
MRDSRLVRSVMVVVPWLGLAILVGVVVSMASSRLANDDTYFHLRFGHEFLSDWSLSHPGSVTTFATRPWVPTQWLPEIVMAKLEDWFGLAGVAWYSGLQMVGLVAALFFGCRRNAPMAVSVVLVAVSLFACSPALSARPQVLSYALVAVTTTAWLRTAEDGRARWWLVPLTWLWAMCHGMWPVGVVIGLVAASGVVLDRRGSPRAVARWYAVPLLSAVVAALTPVGPALYPAVLGVTARRKVFAEWNPPDFTAANVMAFAAMLALLLVLLLRGDRSSWTTTAMVLLACAWGVYSARTVAVATVMTALLLAQRLGPMLPWARHQAGRPGVRLLRRHESVVVWGVLVLGLGVLAAVVPHTADRPPPRPAWLTPALERLPTGTPVLNDWNWGGYLMWRYPRLDLVMNGYGDTFTDAELEDNTLITNLAPGWDTLVRATHARWALLNPNQYLAYALTSQQGWIVAHYSPGVELLKAPAGWAAS